MDEGILDHNLSSSELYITPEIREFLRETAKWGKFLAIIGIVIMVIIGIFAIIATFFMGSLLTSMPGAEGMIGGAFFFVYFGLLICLYVFPVLYLYRFSTKLKVALAQDDQQHLYESFKNLKSLFKFMGIFMAVILGFYGIIILFGVFGGLAALAF